jgi:type I restriction enzyme M protein
MPTPAPSSPSRPRCPSWWTDIDKLDWYSVQRDDLGDLYEGLLERNAGEKKSGAGQYFTPRAI